MDDLKKMAFAAGAAVLLMAEPSVAVAKTAPAPTQGQMFDQILEQQKKGEIKSKIIQGKSAPREKAVYGQQNKGTVKKPATKAPAKKPAKPSSAPKPALKPSSSKPLKFSQKASIGTQGSAPAGLELPVPKGAATKTKATKATAPKPKPAASTSAPKTNPAAPKTKAAAENPLARKKKTAVPAPAPLQAPTPAPTTSKPKAAAENPLARKKKAALTGAGAGTAAVVVEKAVEKAAPAIKAPEEKISPSTSSSSTSSSTSVGLGDASVQAGGVALAELAGLAIASSIVGGILQSKKPQRG